MDIGYGAQYLLPLFVSLIEVQWLPMLSQTSLDNASWTHFVQPYMKHLDAKYIFLFIEPLLRRRNNWRESKCQPIYPHSLAGPLSIPCTMHFYKCIYKLCCWFANICQIHISQGYLHFPLIRKWSYFRTGCLIALGRFASLIGLLFGFASDSLFVKLNQNIHK